MKHFRTLLSEISGAGNLTPHPISSMKDESDSGLDWEYDREYKHYCSEFPKAFDSREHFGEKYKNAEVRHLTPEEHHNLSYSTHTSFISNTGKSQLDRVRQSMGHRRDVDRIANDITSGKTAYPIVLKHSKGLRILAGNTRMSVAAAMGKGLPVKVVDISDRH